MTEYKFNCWNCGALNKTYYPFLEVKMMLCECGSIIGVCGAGEKTEFENEKDVRAYLTVNASAEQKQKAREVMDI